MKVQVKREIGEKPSDYKSQAIAEINRVIGNTRGKYITISPGQEMVYMEKEREAISYLKEYEIDNPSDDDYPHLSAEIGITGDDCWQVARVIVFMAAQWRMKSSQIEYLKLNNIKLVESCKSADECQSIMELFQEIAHTL